MEADPDPRTALDELLDRLLQGQAVDLEAYVAEHHLDAVAAEEAARLLGFLRGAQAEPGRALPLPGVLRAGERLGDYRLIRVLGEGGMGTVYLAEQQQLGRLVALKTLRPEHAVSAKARERFTREARAIGKLRHESIVTIHEAGEAGGVAYLAMELLPGADLQERVRGLGAPLAVPQAVRAARDVARALACAHAAGIVHRDVKPSNIRITPEGRTVLLDFGLAQAEDWQTLTQQGHFRGTPHYAAPEQIDSSLGPVDERSDVYSLGVTLYECVTGRAPFSADSTRGLFHQVLSRDAPAPRSLVPALSRDLDTVIRKAMARERAQRYSSAAAFAADLDALLELRPVEARPLGVLQLCARFVRRRPAVAATCLLALLLFVVVPTAFALWQRASFQRVLRLSDALRLRELEERAGGLWPRRAETIPALVAWLDDAREMLARAELHQSTLAALEERAPAAERGQSLRWQIESLEELVGGLERLPRRIADVEARLAIARAVEPATVGDARALWEQAAADVAASTTYAGLVLVPQVGLVPLEPDPESGLWEFLLWETGERPPRDPETGRYRMLDASGIVLVLIPGGETRIGSQSSSPREAYYNPNRLPGEDLYTTTLEPYFLSKYEVTQAQWQRLTGENPSLYRLGADFTEYILDAERPGTHPVEQLSWTQCVEVLARLELELPTDAQWEHAARAGTSELRWFGGEELREVLAEADNIADASARRAVTSGDGSGCEAWEDGWAFHAPVGCFLPNPFGLHDTLGNVHEWCLERMTYPVRLQPGDGRRLPVEGAPEGHTRIMRGGSFGNMASLARSSYRTDADEGSAVVSVGVRPARRLQRAP